VNDPGPLCKGQEPEGVGRECRAVQSPTQDHLLADVSEQVVIGLRKVAHLFS
jgi:hypothetical protein